MLCIAKKLGAIVIRFVLILLSFIALIHANNFSATLVVFVSNFIYIMLFGLLIIGFWFHKHKACLLTILLLLIKLVLDLPSVLSWGVEFDRAVVLNGVTILLAANVLLLSLFRENQMRFRWMLILLLFICLQVFSVFAIAQAVGSGIIEIIDPIFSVDQFTIQFGHLSQNGSLLLVVGLGVAVLNLLLVPVAFSHLAVNILMSAAIYNFLYSSARLQLDPLFLVIALLTAIYIFKQIYQVSYIDQLTGIPSRRALQEEASKLRTNYVVAMVDIDFFKKFNDKYGHDVGDDVLSFVAAILNKQARGSVFRYGGEEFTLLFPKCSLNECFKHLDEVRQSIAKSKFKVRRGTGKASSSNAREVAVTVSIGVAEQGGKYRTFTEVIKSADKALYRAKKKGRNCVSK